MPADEKFCGGTKGCYKAEMLLSLRKWRHTARQIVERTPLYVWVGCVTIGLGFLIALQNIDRPVRSDEAAHLSAGMEWLEEHRYTHERLHPPLARVWAALPLFLSGAKRAPHAPCAENFQQLYTRIATTHPGGYFPSPCLPPPDDPNLVSETPLHLARAMQLLCYLFACAATYLLARQLAMERLEALFSAMCFSQVPVIIWLGSTVMTDLMFTAFFLLTLVAWLRLLSAPSIPRGMGFAALSALAILSKFSALYFLLPACLALYVWSRRTRSPRPRAKALVSALATGVPLAFFMLWAAYFFHMGRPIDVFPWAPSLAASHPFWAAWLQAELLPMPEWFEGLETARLKAQMGHAGTLGNPQIAYMGEWYFYPLALLVRTPLALLALIALGLAAYARKPTHPVTAALWLFLCLLLPAMMTKITINVHHIAPVFAPLSMIAGTGAAWLFRRRHWGKAALMALLLCLVVSTYSPHANYIHARNALGLWLGERI